VSVPSISQIAAGRFLLSDAVNDSSEAAPTDVFLDSEEFLAAVASLGSQLPIGLSDFETAADFEVQTNPGESVPLSIQLPESIRVSQDQSVYVYQADTGERLVLHDFVYADATPLGCPTLLLPDGSIDGSVYSGDASGKSCIGIVATDGDAMTDSDLQADGVVRMTVITPFTPVDCGDDPACLNDFSLSSVSADHENLQLNRQTGGGSLGPLYLLLLLVVSGGIRRSSTNTLCIFRFEK
jgi:hypothetical protein